MSSITRSSDQRDVLLAPVVSEKSYGLLDGNRYTFIVAPDADKTEIKIAVEKMFRVQVAAVKTLNRRESAADPVGHGQAGGHQASDRQRG